MLGGAVEGAVGALDAKWNYGDGCRPCRMLRDLKTGGPEFFGTLYAGGLAQMLLQL